jgi:hypothetical protein
VEPDRSGGRWDSGFQITSYKGFIDDGHVPRIPVVVFIDGAARQHSGADRIEEPGRYAGPVGGYIVLRAGLWSALNPNVVAPLIAGHRRIG